MTDLTQTLKAGTLLIIESGEYSDRTWEGPVRVVRDFTKQEAADAYRAAWPTIREDWQAKFEIGPQPNDFLSWLIKTGWVEAVEDVTDWHVGSYGEFEP